MAKIQILNDDGTVQKEQSFETGMDEGFKALAVDTAWSWFQNGKITYDQLLELLTTNAKDMATHCKKVLSDAQSHTNNVNNVAVQALQNAVETANMVGKQAVRHGDVAIDGHWGIRESDVWLTALAEKIREKTSTDE